MEALHNINLQNQICRLFSWQQTAESAMQHTQAH